METSTRMPCEFKDDTNQKPMENLWGSSWHKLTPKQKQLVGEILSYLTWVSEKTDQGHPLSWPRSSEDK